MVIVGYLKCSQNSVLKRSFVSTTHLDCCAENYKGWIKSIMLLVVLKLIKGKGPWVDQSVLTNSSSILVPNFGLFLSHCGLIHFLNIALSIFHWYWSYWCFTHCRRTFIFQHGCHKDAFWKDCWYVFIPLK